MAFEGTLLDDDITADKLAGWLDDASALTTAGALVLASAFGTAVVLTGGSGNGATLGMLLAGGYAAYQFMRGTNG